MRPKKYTVLYSNYQEYENEIFCHRIREFYDNGYILYKSIGIRRKILVFKYIGNTKKQCLVMQNSFLESINKMITQLIEEKQKILYQDRKMVVFEIDRDNYDVDKFENEQNSVLGLSYKKITIPILLILSDIFLMGFRIWFYKLDYDNIILSILFLTSFLYLSGDLWDIKKGISSYKNNKLYFDKRSTFKQHMFALGDVICVLLLLSYLIVSLISFFTFDAVIILEVIRSWMIFLLGYVFSFRFRSPFCSILTILFFYAALVG